MTRVRYWGVVGEGMKLFSGNTRLNMFMWAPTQNSWSLLFFFSPLNKLQIWYCMSPEYTCAHTIIRPNT